MKRKLASCVLLVLFLFSFVTACFQTGKTGSTSSTAASISESEAAASTAAAAAASSKSEPTSAASAERVIGPNSVPVVTARTYCMKYAMSRTAGVSVILQKR